MIYYSGFVSATTNQCGDRKCLGNRCFWLSEDSKKPADAAKACAERGGALASINTLKVFHFVKSMLPASWVWIGGHCENCKKVKEDKWVWASGDVLSLRSPMWNKYGSKQCPWDWT